MFSRYLLARYNFTWSDARDIEVPLRVGDVVILPTTAFSPGMQIRGSKASNDPQSMVYHLFQGSWKEPLPPSPGNTVIDVVDVVEVP